MSASTLAGALTRSIARRQVELPSKACLSLVLATLACSDARGIQVPAIQDRAEILIPGVDDWIERGPLFEAGRQGTWDHYLWGGFTISAIRHAGDYLLYYQGSSDYRDDFDPTVCYRSVGLAYGEPLEDFQKFGVAPVLTWSPGDECEEGVSAGAAMSEGREILFYYGANTSTGLTTVAADIRLARSDDGRTFRDAGIVLDHEDMDVWGAGDELFPILAFSGQGRSVLYYVPNGTPVTRQLGVAQGPVTGPFDESRAVVDERGRPVRVWGPAGYARIGSDLMALFVKDGPSADLEVRLVDPSEPHLVSEAVQAYPFADVQQATVVLDEELELWLMFYRGDGFYGLKVAPMRRVSG